MNQVFTAAVDHHGYSSELSIAAKGSLDVRLHPVASHSMSRCLKYYQSCVQEEQKHLFHKGMASASSLSFVQCESALHCLCATAGTWSFYLLALLTGSLTGFLCLQQVFALIDTEC